MGRFNCFIFDRKVHVKSSYTWIINTYMYIHNDSNDEYVIVKFKLKNHISDCSLV